MTSEQLLHAASSAAPRGPSDILDATTSTAPYEVLPFPLPGDLLAAVQIEWDGIEVTGGPIPPDLPRPWEPATCTSTGLQAELATWLTEFVAWLNTQHTWNPDTAVPACWPHHPHLVHDLAVLADQRRRASDQPSSQLLEQWQRITLPSFLDRLHDAVGQRCAASHQSFLLTQPGSRDHEGKWQGPSVKPGTQHEGTRAD